MRTIWLNHKALLETLFYFVKTAFKPRSRFLAEMGYHVSLWIVLGIAYTLSSIQQTRWETYKQPGSARIPTQPATVFAPPRKTMAVDKPSQAGNSSAGKATSRALSSS